MAIKPDVARASDLALLVARYLEPRTLDSPSLAGNVEIVIKGIEMAGYSLVSNAYLDSVSKRLDGIDEQLKVLVRLLGRPVQ